MNETEDIIYGTDWEDTSRLTNKQLVAFLRYEPINHTIGHLYANGIEVVSDVYEEIAKRIENRSDERIK